MNIPGQNAAMIFHKSAPQQDFVLLIEQYQAIVQRLQQLKEHMLLS